MRLSLKIYTVFCTISIFLLILASCKKDPTLAPKTPTIRLESLVPYYFPAAHYQSNKNQLQEKRIALGRKLFYDPILSSSNTMSCGSCHKQAFAFSDAGNVTSPGEVGQPGQRNSPPIFNKAWNTSFMWDGGINNLEVVPFAPITAPHEMNQDVKLLLQELKENAQYSNEFVEAFGEAGITETNFYYSLAQFMSIMISVDSKYDHVKQGSATFSIEESKGYALFKSHCNTCHTEPMFTSYNFENTGLYLQYQDKGRGRVTSNTTDDGKFKVPSLRNIEITQPYMHDGSKQSLQEVLNHYSQGVLSHPNLSPELTGGLPINADDQKALIAFLKTLTDQTFITNPDLANPF